MPWNTKVASGKVASFAIACVTLYHSSYCRRRKESRWPSRYVASLHTVSNRSASFTRYRPETLSKRRKNGKRSGERYNTETLDIVVNLLTVYSSEIRRRQQPSSLILWLILPSLLRKLRPLLKVEVGSCRNLLCLYLPWTWSVSVTYLTSNVASLTILHTFSRRCQ
jgi:hypothetical protein